MSKIKSKKYKKTDKKDKKAVNIYESAVDSARFWH